PRADRRRRLRRRLRWALGLGGFLAVSAGLEITARVAVPLHPRGWFVAGPSPDRYFVPAPGLTYTLGGSTFTHGPLGTPLGSASRKGDGRRRIAFLGDSVCYGFYASGEENLSRRVEAGLGAQRVESLNFGVPGYNAHMVSATLREHALEFGPAAVIYVFHENDLTNATHADAFRARPSLFRERYDPPASVWKRILTSSRAVTFVMDRSRGGKGGGGETGESGAEGKREPPEAYTPWGTTLRSLLFTDGRHRRYFREHLSAMQAACAKRGVPFALLFVPREETIYLDTGGVYRDELRKLCGEVGVAFLDGQAAFMPRSSEQLYGDATHPNGRGHAALATLCLPWLRTALGDL
ncbi:MAG: SGNH/GDSL hydrolase family protein, partial [Planctomycetes bacterium]|nr:SGNH/GDSL hydrolase family protein [Planctomycetota bacterium]